MLERPSCSRPWASRRAFLSSSSPEFRRAGGAAGVDEELGARLLAVDQRDQRGGAVLDRGLEVEQDGLACAAPLSSWMKMCTIPPHIRPTVPASSSEIP